MKSINRRKEKTWKKAKYGIKSDFGEAVGKITQQQEEKPKEKPEEPEGTEEEPK